VQLVNELGSVLMCCAELRVSGPVAKGGKEKAAIVQRSGSASRRQHQASLPVVCAYMTRQQRHCERCSTIRKGAACFEVCSSIHR
jgi:hypothetical protein